MWFVPSNSTAGLKISAAVFKEMFVVYVSCFQLHLNLRLNAPCQRKLAIPFGGFPIIFHGSKGKQHSCWLCRCHSNVSGVQTNIRRKKPAQKQFCHENRSVSEKRRRNSESSFVAAFANAEH